MSSELTRREKMPGQELPARFAFHFRDPPVFQARVRNALMNDGFGDHVERIW
jgi:hypothetical protein